MEFKRPARKTKQPAIHSEPQIHAEEPLSNASYFKRIPPNVRRIIIIFAILIVVVIGVAVIIQIVASRNANEPSYQTILPAGQSINVLGGWHRVTPPGEDPVFAYNDTIDAISISVSEQPLPDSFAKDTASKIADFAKQGNYSIKITAGSTTAYVGTNAKGPQSVVLAKNNLLIFIKSQSVISNDSWTRYITSLN